MFDHEKEIEKNVFDGNEEIGQEIKINPEAFIHKALMSAIEALKNESLKEGLIIFRILIETAENAGINAGFIVEDEYNASIKEFKKENNFKEDSADIAQNAKLANKKFGLIMKYVQESKAMKDNLTA